MKYLQLFEKYNETSFKKWFGDSKVVDFNGKPKKVYHQTSKEAVEGINKIGFIKDKGVARIGDSEVPDGIFFKPDKTDISVGGKEQIEVYLSIQNPLIVTNREDLIRIMSYVSNEYKEVAHIIENIDKEYGEIFDKYWKSEDLRDKAKDGTIDTLLKEWKFKIREQTKLAREIITQYLIDNGYDGMIIEEDKGSFGRITKTYIALYPNQIKSTSNIGSYSKESPLINEKIKLYEDFSRKKMSIEEYKEEILKPYKYFLLCDKLCDLKGVEVKNDMIYNSKEVSKEEFVEKCAFSEQMFEMEAQMLDDPDTSFHKSNIEGENVYYMKYSGFEYIFIENGELGNDFWMDEMYDDKFNYIYESIKK